MNLILHNEIHEVSRLEGWLEALSEHFGFDPILIPGLNLALEEAATNVILYAYPQGTDGTLEITASCENGALTFVMADSGKPFDPTARPPVDITARAEDRPIGGLGIHLVLEIMDKVLYTYDNGQNILTMIKNI